MSLSNTPSSFGALTRTFHWLTALLILTAIPLGLYGESLPFDTSEALAQKAQVFSLHKTVGVAAFFLGLARILWAFGQTRPQPLHPDRKLETFAAEAAHWMLYLSMVLVPLSGWIHHSAVTGFAPIWWPFGQNLPFVPKSETLGHAASLAHWVFSKLLAVSVLAHIGGALKHHFFDRDATLARMMSGKVAPVGATAQAQKHSFAPLALALAIYAAGAGLAVSMLPSAAPAEAAQTTEAAPVAAATAGNWQVEAGTITFSVQQMGAGVEGSFETWSADITFDEAATDGKHGSVAVDIDLATLTLGSVTDQAKGPEFFDVPNHPKASFAADILAASTGYEAKGTLTLHGVTKELTLPFTLTITGDTAAMAGTVQLDRRDFGIGATYGDEATVGFGVTVTIALTAKKR